MFFFLKMIHFIISIKKENIKLLQPSQITGVVKRYKCNTMS